MSTDDRHDRLFKGTFSNVRHLEVELRAVLAPELAAGIDFSSLRVLRTEMEVPGISPMRGDLLVEAMLFGEPVQIMILVEHQSTVDDLMLVRCVGYLYGVWTEHIKTRRAQGVSPLPLPIVLPVVVYHGKSEWTAARAFHSLFAESLIQRESIARYVPAFGFILDDLSHLPSEEIMARLRKPADESAVVVMLALRNGWDLEAFLQELLSFGTLPMDLVHTDGGLDAFREILGYFDTQSGRAFRKSLEHAAELVHAHPGAKDAVMSIAEVLINEGRAEGEITGEARGEARGKAEGKAEIVLKQLTLKFGTLSAATQDTVRGATSDVLDVYAERILFDTTLSEVLG